MQVLLLDTLYPGTQEVHMLVELGQAVHLESVQFTVFSHVKPPYLSVYPDLQIVQIMRLLHDWQLPPKPKLQSTWQV